MSGFTDWFSVNTVVGIVDYVINWYETLAGTPSGASDSDSEEEWGQFVVIDEEKI